MHRWTTPTRRIRPCPLALLSAFLFWGQQAGAQGVANYNDVILGAQAAALGGAFTAVANDSTASVHNPAGLADAPSTGLSLSVNAYGFQRQLLHEVIRSEQASVDLTLDSILFYPGATAYVLPLSEGEEVKHTIAFSLVAPRYFDIEGVQNLSLPSEGVDFDIFQSRTQRVLQGGPSYAVRKGWFAFGASVFVQYASFTDQSTNAVTLSHVDGGETAGRGLNFEFTEGEYWGLTGVVGTLFDLTPSTRLGINLQLPSLRLAGRTTSFVADAGSYVETHPGMAPDVALYQDIYRGIQGETVLRTPWVVSLGFMQRIKDHLFSVDVDFYSAIPSHEFVSEAALIPPPEQVADLPGLEDRRGFHGRVVEPARRVVLNASLGTSLRVHRQWDLLLGAFTDFSNVPSDNVDTYPSINMFGGSVGLQRHDENSSFTVSLLGRGGAGVAGGAAFDSEMGFLDRPVDATQWSLMVVIGGSRALSDGARAPVVEIGRADEIPHG